MRRVSVFIIFMLFTVGLRAQHGDNVSDCRQWHTSVYDVSTGAPTTFRLALQRHLEDVPKQALMPPRRGIERSDAFSVTAPGREDSAFLRDPAASSVLLMPSGRTVPPGTGTLGLAAPYIPYAAFSILPGVQVSAGGIYIFESAGGNDRAYYSYLIVKNSLYDDGSSSIAVGAAVMFWGQEFMLGSRHAWDHVALPAVFAAATFGDEETALTLGMGFAEMAGGFGIGFDGGVIAGVGLGYETRISRGGKFLTEHLTDALTGNTMHTAGVRFFSGRAAFDLGLVIIPNADITLSRKRIPLILPVLGVSIHIG
jgi:hypothetical protein